VSEETIVIIYVYRSSLIRYIVHFKVGFRHNFILKSALKDRKRKKYL